ncbi:dihydroxyacetone kinase subunit DhaK [[Clostridium] innocuum]|nr:dihydroxyacetone kinase subunit DhaK [[Clostridium] innocuum]
MKKIINNPNAVVEEMLQGIEIANPDVLYDREGVVITRKEKSDKVGLVSGGGSGHEPAHAGYVGYGMLDAAVSGNVFASPSPDRVLRGIQLADSGHGVLLIIKNYAGDIMNFEIAEELAGAKAETGASLAEVKRVAEKTIENVRSFGVSLSACTIPAVGTCGFTIEEDCMEVGMGIHGEAGIEKTKLKPSKEIADIMVNRILADKDYGHSEVAVMINGLGATPLMELYILASDVHTRLCAEGLKPVKYYVGNYMTAIEMAGASCSILQLDEELKRLLEYPSNTPAFKEIG